jgi:glutamyl-tRNA synthetase
LANGRFIVRIDDLDTGRVRPGAESAIADDLAWLGIDWDIGPGCSDPTTYRQSARLGLYAGALDRLGHRAYPCFCSRKDIRHAATAPHGAEFNVYPGTCRELTAADVERRRLANRQRAPSLRLRVDDGVVTFHDELLGAQCQRLASDCGDFVVKRADGVFAYHLACVVDEAVMGVTDVVRGADLVSSTPRQLFLFRCLGYPVPRYWHVPVLRDAAGQRLAKRSASASLAPLKRQGLTPADVVGRLAHGAGLQPTADAISARALLHALAGARLQALLRMPEGTQ